MTSKGAMEAASPFETWWNETGLSCAKEIDATKAEGALRLLMRTSFAFGRLFRDTEHDELIGALRWSNTVLKYHHDVSLRCNCCVKDLAIGVCGCGDAKQYRANLELLKKAGKP